MYYQHLDVATYLGGDPDIKTNWAITDPVSSSTGMIPMKIKRN